jgi:23S rRNA (guanosine2251-2'-O)-methyltransferase
LTRAVLDDLADVEAPIVLEGHVSVEAALAGESREVLRVWAVRPGDRRLRHLRYLARQRGVTIDRVEPERVAEVVSGSSHGGVVGLVGPRRYLRFAELMASAGPSPLLVMLEGVEDPFNFGQAIRSLHAAGVDGLVVGPRSWDSAAAIVARASAGASELMATASVDEVREAIDGARNAGLQVLAADDAPESTSLYDVNLTGGTLLVVGGERRGISRSLQDRVDGLVRIPYGRQDAAPLGAAAAAAVIAFEALRQRGAEGASRQGPD